MVCPLVTVANCEQFKGLFAHNSADYCTVRAVTCIDPDLLAAEPEVVRSQSALTRDLLMHRAFDTDFVGVESVMIERLTLRRVVVVRLAHRE